jgi:molecular chaperone DnaK (HSP70)
MLHMKLADLESIFEPIVEEIIQLVKDQIKATKKTIKAVLLVGGFGQNSYLKERLQGTLSKETEITQPPNGWTAVVRGAVMKGLGSNLAGIQVRSRVARKHYGIRISVKYDPKRHLEATR